MVDMICLNGYYVMNLFCNMQTPAVMQASQIQKGGAERGIVPAGYIAVPANVQQFVANQAAIRPSIVYMVPVCQIMK